MEKEILRSPIIVGWQDKKSLPERNCYMLQNKLMTDVCFNVPTRDGGRKRILAHKFILVSCSSVFEAMFCGGMAESSSSATDPIVVTDIKADTFEIMLHYMYCEEIELSASNVKEIMYAATKYLHANLIDQCNTFLQEIVSPDNACVSLELSLQYNLKTLKEQSLQYISENTDTIFASDEFLELSQEALVCILSLEDMEFGSAGACEEEVFDAAINWAKQKLLVDASNEHPTDEEIRNCLGNLFYKIRFPTMDKEIFAKKFGKSGILSDQEKIALFCYFLSDENNGDMKFSDVKRSLSSSANGNTPLGRFASVIHGWGCSGSCDAIDVTASTKTILTGVGLYGNSVSGTKYNVTLEIIEGSVCLDTTTPEYISNGTSTPIYVPTSKQVKMEANIKYTVKATIKGENSYYGTGGQAVYTMNGVTFTFSNAPQSTNGTNITSGQIPQLYVKF